MAEQMDTVPNPLLAGEYEVNKNNNKFNNNKY